MQFYLIDQPDAVDDYAYCERIEDSYLPVCCEICKGILLLRRIGASIVDVYGENVVDFLWSGLYTLFATEKVIELFQEAKITGVRYDLLNIREYTSNAKSYNGRCFPIKIIEISPTGKGIYVARDAYIGDFIGKKDECIACRGWQGTIRGTYPSRLVFSLEDWDGSDIFNVFPIGLVCTERLIDVLRQGNIRNYKAVHVDFIE